MGRVVGLDVSLTSTGLCVIDGSTIRVRRVPSKPGPDLSLAGRSRRLRGVVQQIWPYVIGADLVAIEGPAYGSKTGSMHDRSGLWWLLAARLTGHGVRVVEITPASLKMYATGSGTADKDRVLAAVIRRYPQVEIMGNDEADALVLAAIARRWLGDPLEPSLPEHHTRALNKIAWPTQK